MTTPDILLIMADQLAPHWMGTYGHPLVKTPHTDALAARGMRFDAAYCNSPLCVPSRASFMAGQLPSRIAAYDNAAEFPSAIPTFAHYLTQKGYRSCLSGKMHFVGPDQKHGFTDRLTTDIYPADFDWTPDWTRPDARIDKWYHNMRTVKESGWAVATYQTDYDDEAEFTARKWLIDRARDRAAGDPSPFCMVASFFHPHDPYVAKPEFWDMYDPADIELPDGDLADDPHSARLITGIEADKDVLTRAELIAARRAYFANVTYFDSKVGALVQALKDAGTYDNTLIIVTSDHGDMLGERGLWFKMSFFDHSARVPLVMAGPGVAQGACGSICSLVDLMPTMLDAAGGLPDLPDLPNLGAPIDGRSLMPLARGETDSDGGEAIGEYMAEMTGWPVYMIRRGPWKYIHCRSDPPQLYNLEKDPSERVNLAGDPAHADQAAAFAAEVARRWDCAALQADVIANQAARHVVRKAMETGAEPWDYNPPRDASQEYVRNHLDWEGTATRQRFPPFASD